MITMLRLKGLNSKLNFNFAKDKVPTRNGYGDALVELGENKKCHQADLVRKQ